MLTPHADGLWSLRVPHRFMGWQFGARMTVAALPDGLWVCSPVPLDGGVREAVEALGTVRHLVCPNALHHLWAGEARRAWPDALLHGPAALVRKRPDLAFDRVLDGSPPAWDAAVLTPFPVAGQPMMEESVFLHRPSGTLITTDLVLHLTGEHDAWTRLYLWAIGYQGAPMHSPLLRYSTWKDPDAARRTLAAILDEDWDGLILAHGEALDRGGKAALAAAFAWLLGPSPR